MFCGDIRVGSTVFSHLQQRLMRDTETPRLVIVFLFPFSNGCFEHQNTCQSVGCFPPIVRHDQIRSQLCTEKSGAATGDVYWPKKKVTKVIPELCLRHRNVNDLSQRCSSQSSDYRRRKSASGCHRKVATTENKSSLRGLRKISENSTLMGTRWNETRNVSEVFYCISLTFPAHRSSRGKCPGHDSIVKQ